MTNEEAINVINSLIRQFTRLEQPTAVEGLEVAKNALEKRMPQKVVAHTRCPSCGEDVIGSGYYCWNCGQRLDWGDKNE